MRVSAGGRSSLFALAVLAVGVTGPTVLADSAPPRLAAPPPGARPATDLDGQSPAQLCDNLCGTLYGSAGEKRDLCLDGCRTAANCTNQCRERFDDPDELDRCDYRCARAR